MNHKPYLRGVLTHTVFPFESLYDTAPDGESLEVVLPGIEAARPQPGKFIFQRFARFLPFSPEHMQEADSLGEGNTPLLKAPKSLQENTGLHNLWLKNETVNPTWSFKDRGSLTTIFMARVMQETVTATISTGNMGNSMAAYSAHAGMEAVVFIPHFSPVEKVGAMAIHGARIIRIKAPDYSAMKSAVLEQGLKQRLRIVSGNGPLRTEGYKLTSFELFEQFNESIPDFIAVPTSACGHIRGVFKGFLELKAAGLIHSLPRMIIVQAEVNSPIVSAYNKGLEDIIPFKDFSTVAEAITSGNPAGGKDLLYTARKYNWLAESASEEEILDSQRVLAAAGFFTEPSSALSVAALRKQTAKGFIPPDARVVLMLTGSGLKDMRALTHQPAPVQDIELQDLDRVMASLEC